MIISAKDHHTHIYLCGLPASLDLSVIIPVSMTVNYLLKAIQINYQIILNALLFLFQLENPIIFLIIM